MAYNNQKISFINKLSATLHDYWDWNVLSMLFLGFASAVPFLLTLSTLDLWLIETGVSKTTVGLFALIHIPYSLKFVFACFIDSRKLPFFTKQFGHYRGWVVCSQIVIILGLITLAFINPKDYLWATAVVALIVTAATACQDLVLYNYQLAILNKASYGPGAACATCGWRIGLFAASAGAIYLADIYDWTTAYLIMAFLCLINTLIIAGIKEPKNIAQNRQRLLKNLKIANQKNFFGQIYQSFLIAITLLKQFPGWPLIMAFVMLFKVGDTLSHKMAYAFYVELGFTKSEIAQVVKLFGMIASALGALVAGVITKLMGTLRGVIICGLAHMLAQLLFILLGYYGHSMQVFYLVIAIENSTNGMMSVALIAYLYNLSPNFTKNTILVAFLWAMVSFSRTIFGSVAGLIAEYLSWPWYFTLSSLISIPSLFLIRIVDKMQKQRL